MTRERFLITSALPYANGPLHFGHIAGAYLPADIFNRYARLAGHETIYICGSDEYGAAISLAAEKAGRSPKEHADIFHNTNKALFDTLNIRFDNFSRTTNKHHAATSQSFFIALRDKGYLTLKETERQYCPSCDRYLPDRFVVGECYICHHEEARGDECPKCGTFLDETKLIHPRCKLYGHPAELRKTSHWQLRLDLLRDKLQAWLDTKKDFWKSNVLSSVQATLNDARPRDITRDLDWGVPVPGQEGEKKVLYVWFDAPIGYLSATIEWAEKRGEPEAWKRWWLDEEVKLIHFIGKDNITFHCVTWPGMLIEQDVPYILPHDVPANEFFNLEGDKFNKGKGWTIDTEDFFTKYSADALRWTIARNAPETRDSEFTWADFQSRVNAELNDTFGNLVTRILRGFVALKFDGVVPAAELSAGDLALLAQVDEQHRLVGEALARYQVRKATDAALQLGFLANKYVEDQAPWKSIKKDPARCAACINTGVRVIERLALTLLPFIPDSAELIWAAAGGEGALAEKRWGQLEDRDPAGRELEPFKNPFEKISKKQVKQEVEALHERLNKAKEEAVSEPSADAKKSDDKPEDTQGGFKPEISYDDFVKLDMRVATVKTCAPVEGADRLLKLDLDVGGEPRTVVSGIRAFYEPESLVGRQVIYLANLKPRKLRGVMSQGMVLAVNEGDAAVLLKAEKDCTPGSLVS